MKALKAGGVAIAVFLALAAGTGAVYGQTCGESDSTRRGGGDGNDVPTPFTSNQKVELADGEDYTLVGELGVHGESVYFVIDFSEHPWLASAKRRANPIYPVKARASVMERYHGVRVKMSVRAISRILIDGSSQEADYVIALVPISEPVRYALRDHSGRGKTAPRKAKKPRSCDYD